MKINLQRSRDSARLVLVDVRNTVRISLMLLITATPAVAQGQKHCSNSTLKGAYGNLISGVRFLAGWTENFVGLSRRTFDGNGNFIEESASSHGVSSGKQVSSAPPTGTYSGTYHVNPDCTGTATLSSPLPGVLDIVSNFIIVQNGDEVREIVMATGTNIAIANYKRMR